MKRISVLPVLVHAWARLRVWRGRWAVLAILVAFLPVSGMFSPSRIFALRDLSIYYWPKYRWLRATIFSGEWPWWDPYMAAGQSAASDAMLQIFFLPTLLLRLALPEVLGFNLWVALPYPLGALGMYLFARRHLSRQAAAVAAIVLAVSGPFVSTSDFPNVAWTALAVPWVLWASDRCVRRRDGAAFVVLACCVAAQVLAGEPVTMTATMVLAVAYVGSLLLELRVGWVVSVRAIALVVAGMVAGAALSAVQLLPLLHAAAHSPRRETAPEYFWSLHPLGLVETIAPNLFGDIFQWLFAAFPWMQALSSGRDPFFFSIYCGVPVFALVLLGVFAGRRRWTIFWVATAAAAVLLSLGNYTPIYPALQETFSAMRSFRFPPKYLIVAMLALGMLAGYGWQALAVASRCRQPVSWRVKAPALAFVTALAITGYGATLMALFFRSTLIDLIYRLALVVKVPNIIHGVTMMTDAAEPQGRRLLLLSAGTAFLLWAASAGRRESRMACVALLATICADLVVTNQPVDSMQPVAYLGKPDWVRVVERYPADRFYFAGRLRGYVDERDIDGPKRATLPAFDEGEQIRTKVQGLLGIVPSQWRIREMLSYDLPMLFPIEYELMVERFEAAPRDQRLRFLSAAGVRECVMAVPPRPGLPGQARVPWFDDLDTYECDPQATRVRVVPPFALVEPVVAKQIDLLFRPQFDARTVVLLHAEPPPPAGMVGPPVQQPYARFMRDESMAVDIAAGVGAQGGFLVLADFFDDDWHAEVDGQPTPVLPADGMFRALRLVRGEHTVRFRYRPRFVYYGAAISLSASLGLGAVLLVTRARRPAHTPATARAALGGDPTAPPVRV